MVTEAVGMEKLSKEGIKSDKRGPGTRLGRTRRRNGQVEGAEPGDGGGVAGRWRGSQTPREANVSERSQGEWPNAAQVSSEMRTKTSPLGLCLGWRLLPGREPFRPRNGNEVRGEREVQKRRQRDSV